MRHARTLILALAFIVIGYAGYKVTYLTKPPGEKECEPLIPVAIDEKDHTLELDEAPFSWAQFGGTINDASCVDETAVAGIVAVRSEEDVRAALAYARERGLTVSAAGVKHSMGGHAFSKGGLVLDMRSLSAIEIHEDSKTMTVGSGATWHDIQNALHPRYAVKAMQSTDIFTVGGSISVNAHGMDHQAGALENSIVSMRVMKADGDIVRLSRTENSDLYELVVGGYGLFGVILDAVLQIEDNVLYESRREIISYGDFPRLFEQEIEHDERVGLMYTHLSTAPGASFLDEAIVYRYEKQDDVHDPSMVPPLGEISSVKLRRLVMNLSKYGGVFQTMRWWSEKYLEPRMESCTISRANAIGSGEACLVTRNEPMHDSVPYLMNSLKGETDILHEYFIPRRNLTAFIDGLRTIVRQNDTNLLNASIRVVHKERGFLSYAPEPAYSVVLYINQKTDADGHARMQKVTQELIDLSSSLGGRFFLPYQLHYSSEQLRTAYPMIDDFFAAKRRIDPDGLFSNTWYERYAKPGERAS